MPAWGQATKGRKYALLVGVNEYDNAALPGLKYTENDVEELAAILSSKASGFDEVRVLTVARGKQNKEDMPTAANVERAIDALVARKRKHDTVLVGLAGHGVQLSVEDPDGRGPPRSYSYFCPADADFLNVSYSTGKSDSLVLLDSLFRRVGKCGASNRLVLIDACRNEVNAKSSTRNVDVEQMMVPKGVGVLFSCRSGERAWETAKLGKGHGVFFYHVVQGLRGEAKNRQGRVTWERLTAYVREEVPAVVPKLIGGGATQTPHGILNLDSQAVLAEAAPGPTPGREGVSRPGWEAERLFREAMSLYEGARSLRHFSKSPDYARALRLFRRAAEKGHAVARGWAGCMVYQGLGTARNVAEGRQMVAAALPAIRAATEAGDADAMAFLGLLHSHGLDVERDRKEAASWYRKAAELGHADGMLQVAHMHRFGGGGYVKDTGMAVRWYRKAAEVGSTSAMMTLAYLFRVGEGVEKDPKAALKWYRKAAEAGDAMGMSSLGTMYLTGEGGLERDQKQANRWFRKAAEKGDSFSMLIMALGYEYGTYGLEKDEPEAARWYRKAADTGLSTAMIGIGHMYENGRGGLEKSEQQAARWYARAARLGDKAAGPHLTRLGYETPPPRKEDEPPW